MRFALNWLGALFVLLACSSISGAQQVQEPAALRVERSHAPGASGIEYRVTLINDSSADTPVAAAVIDAPLHWVKNVTVSPATINIAAGSSQVFSVRYDVSADAPAEMGESFTVYFPMGDTLPLHQLEMAINFGGVSVPLPELLEPKSDIVEFQETFEAGSEGNGVVFSVENSTAFPVEELNLRPHLPSQFMLLERIEPLGLTLEPGETAEITAYFSVREDAPEDAQDSIEFHFETSKGVDLALGAYRMVATIDAPEEEEAVAACNSAVEAGGDSGGGVTVDLGGFTGRAGFTWEMYNVKDQMNVSVGGVTQTTGCVSHSGTFVLDIPAGARTAKVEVVPNCEGTTGTQWRFRFECPLASDITADGSGNTLENDDDNPGSSTASSTAGQATVPGAGTTALGAPVQQPSPPLQPVGLNGTTIVEADGNETIETAVQTSIGTVVVGAIATRGDADFYRLSIPGRGELKVEFTRSPAEVNLTFRILNHDGIVVSGWHTAPQSGAVFEKRIDIVKAGEILIEVRDAYNDASSSGEYRMQTTFIPAQDDASEPNNVLAQATPLSWNVATRANILPRGDADLYLVSAPRQGRMTVEFTESGPETGITFRVLDKSGKVVRSWQSAPSAGELYQAWADLPEPANYFVEVRDSYNDARSATPYVIVASLDQTPDNGEPNNAVAVATPLAIGQGLDASILPKGDADNYALKIPHQGELTLEFPRSAPNTNLTFRILSETGKVVRTWQTASAAGEPHKGSADIAEPGDYILEVRDAYNDAASPFPYRLETRFKPTEDWAEPNNSNSASTEITLDGNYSANILPKGDADIYSVDIDHPGILEISVTESAPETNMTVRVLDIAGAVVSNWGTAPAAGKPFEATADVSSAGTYLIEIRDAYNDARSADPYRFSVQHKRSTDVLEPNDTANDARAISFGQNVAAAIFPKGDHDLYKFAVANPGEVSIQLTQSPADLNMVFQIERPDGSVVSSWRGASKRGDLFRIGVNIDQAGTYYLRFADSYSDARATEAYGFSVSLD